MTYRITVYLNNGIEMGASTDNKTDVDRLVEALTSAWGGRSTLGLVTIDGEPTMHFNPAFVAAVTVAQEGVSSD